MFALLIRRAEVGTPHPPSKFAVFHKKVAGNSPLKVKTNSVASEKYCQKCNFRIVHHSSVTLRLNWVVVANVRYIEFDREQTLLCKVKLPQDKKTMSLTRDCQLVMFQENPGHLRLTR